MNWWKQLLVTTMAGVSSALIIRYLTTTKSSTAVGSKTPAVPPKDLIDKIAAIQQVPREQAEILMNAFPTDVLLKPPGPRLVARKVISTRRPLFKL